MYRREEVDEKVYEFLKNKTNKVLPTFADVMLFAAMLGYLEKVQRNIRGRNHQIIKDEIFNQGNRQKIMEIICLAETQSIDVFKSDSVAKNAKIIDQYANAGIKKIKELISISDGKFNANAMNVILDYLINQGYIK